MSDGTLGLIFGLILGICGGVVMGVNFGRGIADIKWCERMKDTTWSECIMPGEQVKVIKDAL